MEGQIEQKQMQQNVIVQSRWKSIVLFSDFICVKIFHIKKLGRN